LRIETGREFPSQHGTKPVDSTGVSGRAVASRDLIRSQHDFERKRMAFDDKGG
jgi:hypothetical protein